MNSFLSILCNIPSKLPVLFFPCKWSLWFFLTNLRALSVMSNSFPNYLLQMQMTLTTIKLFDLKRLGDYGMQFYTSFNDFVRANLTLWINLPLDLKIKWYCIDIIKGNLKPSGLYLHQANFLLVSLNLLLTLW